MTFNLILIYVNLWLCLSVGRTMFRYCSGILIDNERGTYREAMKRVETFSGIIINGHLRGKISTHSITVSHKAKKLQKSSPTEPDFLLFPSPPTSTPAQSLLTP